MSPTCARAGAGAAVAPGPGMSRLGRAPSIFVPLLAASVALGGSGCSVALTRHRALGVAADVSVAGGVALLANGLRCDSGIDCFDDKIYGDFVGPTLIAAGLVMGAIGLASEGDEATRPNDGAIVVVPRERPPVPFARDPETLRLAELSRVAASNDRCDLAEPLLADLGAGDAVYLGILAASGAVAPCR